MESYFIVKGGVKLKGEIQVRGAKNAVLKSMAAALLFSDEVKIANVPFVEDVFRMRELLRALGAEVKLEENRVLSIKTENLASERLDTSIAKKIRASVVLIGPLLARQKKVIFPYPGGCVIGKRPIDFFLDGWTAMGAEIGEAGQEYEIKAKQLQGCDFTFRNITVTGTESLMMSAVLANGITILRNAASEPEIPALAEFLNKCGAKISGAGTGVMIIKGTNGKLLQCNGNVICTIPDRIETGSLLVLGALLGDPMRITHCEPEHIAVPLAILKSAGVNIKHGNNWIEVCKPDFIKTVDIKTREYPGFPTDLQAPFAVFMTQAQGQSMIFETVFEGRLNYIEDLNRMGAQITMCDPHRIIITGPNELGSREIESPDIRGGLAFLIAALIAKGESRINNVYQIDRGYERIEERLNALGAEIERVIK